MHKSILQQRAKQLRRHSTDAEKKLWFQLRHRRLGVKFKRQLPLGHYIVDFICIEKRLIIELDGGQHQNNQTYDLIRTQYFDSIGFKVIRFWNHEVFGQLSAVIEVIEQHLKGVASRQ